MIDRVQVIRVRGARVVVERSPRGHVTASSTDRRLCMIEVMDSGRRAALADNPAGWAAEMRAMEERLIGRLRAAVRGC